MSLRAMAVRRAAEEGSPSQQQVELKVGTEEQKLTSQLTDLIPAEALAAYVAAMAAALHSSYHVRMLLFWLVLVLTPLWIVCIYWLAAKNEADAAKVPLLEVLVGTVAFVAWALTVPNTPFQEHLLLISSKGLSVQSGLLITIAVSIVLGFLTTVGAPACKRHQSAKRATGGNPPASGG